MIVDSPIIVTMAPDYQALASTMTTVKVSHVSVGATEGDLQNVFFLAGSIMYIEMHRETKVAYITFRDLQGAKEAVNFSGATIVDSSVTVTMAPDYQLSPSLVQMGTVTIQLMCKTQRVGLVIGKGRATIKAILADTGANVTTSPLMPGYQVVTIASFENVQGYSSPVLSAARSLIHLCMTTDARNHEVIILVNNVSVSCIDDVSVEDWSKSTGSFITVSKMTSKDYYLVKISGAKEAVLRASFRVVCRLRDFALL